MSYILESVTLRSPSTFEEVNSTMFAQQRTLSGAIGRDYFGDNKRVWRLEYNTVNATDYTAIKNLYNTYLAGSTLTWEITEPNYTISQTDVHVDLLERGFSVKGTDYLSDFTLTLTEA